MISIMKEAAEGYFRLTQQDIGAFADGVLTNGGPGVGTFRKMMGDKQTEEFLKKYMFCCR